MVKKVLISLVVLGLVVCGVWLVGAKSMSMEQGAKSSANPSKSVKSVSKNPKSKVRNPKSVGTPTVQQLLDKVEDNYHQIQDLKADYKVNAWGSALKYLGIIGDLFTHDEKFFFKAPDKLKWIPPKEVLTIIIKNNTEYRRMGIGMAFVVTQDTPVGNYKLPWYTLLLY